MQITFFIGNGFDLNLGLKTSFSDFLESYREPQPGDSEDIRRFKNEILTDELLWSNAELAFGRYTEKCQSLGISSDTFCDLKEHFCDKLAEYLEAQESLVDASEIAHGFGESLKRITSGLSTIQREQLQSVIEKHDSGFIYNFIVFNYTEIIDRILSAGCRNKLDLGTRRPKNTNHGNTIGKTIHVHGTTKQDMVLGVNDISQIASPELFDGAPPENIASLIKIETNHLFEERADERTLDLLNKSHLVYVYGMALGETDSLWWDRLCKWLASNPSNHVIIHGFGAPNLARHFRRSATFKKSIKSRLLALATDADDAILDRIHIDTSNIFEGIKNTAKKEISRKIAGLPA